MPPLLQKAIGSILRALLQVAAGYFVTKGYWTEVDASDYVYAFTSFLLALGWSLWEKYKSRLRFLEALDLPAGSSESKVTGLGPINPPKKLVIAFLIFALGGSGCASGGAFRVEARRTALAVGQLALAIDQAERQIFAAGVPGYTKERHDQAGKIVLVILEAAQVFERAAAAIPSGSRVKTADMLKAETSLVTALGQLQALLSEVQAPNALGSAIGALRTALEVWMKRPVAHVLDDLELAIAQTPAHERALWAAYRSCAPDPLAGTWIGVCR